MENRVIKFKIWDEFPKYEIGSDGSVYSLKYNNTAQRKELRQYLDQDGYKYVVLVVNRKRYKRSVHRMVAFCFVENPDGKPQVNHKDGVRHNNCESNLEWCTSQENTIHGFRVNGRKQSEKQTERARTFFSGESNPKAKLNSAEVLSIKRLRQKGLLLKEIAARFNISTAQVSAIMRNKFWAENPDLLK